MATQTQHFNLTKPDWEDRASISVLNANTDIIDAQMYDNEQSAANAIGNMAAEYDDTATYEVGDFCIYSEVLYKCVTAVSVAEAFDSTKWTQTTAAENFGSGGGGGGGSSTLSGLTDVTLTSPTDGQALVYDGASSKWVNGNVASGGSSGGCGIFIDTSVTLQAFTAITSTSEVTYTATRDCAVVVSLANASGNDTRIKIDNVLVGGQYIENIGSANYLYYLQKGQTIGMQISYTNSPSNGYTVYGVKSNVIETALIYSTEEREVGVWTDGKPLYQKTISVTASGSWPSQFTTLESLPNLETCVRIELTIHRTSGMYYTANGSSSAEYTSVPNYTTYKVAGCVAGVGTNPHLEYYVNGYTSSDVDQIWFTLCYTKTTDTAGSGTWTTKGSYAQHYSTTEQVVGTWIDGKPLYQKTVVFGDVSSSSNSIELSTGLTNIEKIFVNASASQVSDGTPLPYVYYSVTNIIGYFFNMNSGSPILCIRAGDGMKQYLSNTIVTFLYTKTTDTV